MSQMIINFDQYPIDSDSVDILILIRRYGYWEDYVLSDPFIKAIFISKVWNPYK